MRVLVQYWSHSENGEMCSLSKDKAQLDATIADHKERESEADEFDPVVETEGEALEIEIPDSSIFAEMVESRTVFLHDDEMDIVYDNLPQD